MTSLPRSVSGLYRRRHLASFSTGWTTSCYLSVILHANTSYVDLFLLAYDTGYIRRLPSCSCYWFYGHPLPVCNIGSIDLSILVYYTVSTDVSLPAYNAVYIESTLPS